MLDYKPNAYRYTLVKYILAILGIITGTFLIHDGMTTTTTSSLLEVNVGSGAYNCVSGKEQKGIEKILEKQMIMTRDECGELCDKTKNCVTFDYDEMWKKCGLSRTPWSAVPAVAPGFLSRQSKGKWACEKTKGITRKQEGTSNTEKQEAYNCVSGRVQKGTEKIVEKTFITRDECAELCDTTENCITFDYDSTFMKCSLSKTPWRLVPPVGGLFNMPVPGQTACEKKNFVEEESQVGL